MDFLSSTLKALVRMPVTCEKPLFRASLARRISAVKQEVPQISLCAEDSYLFSESAGMPLR